VEEGEQQGAHKWPMQTLLSFFASTQLPVPPLFFTASPLR
jgi:hypothetical protein